MKFLLIIGFTLAMVVVLPFWAEALTVSPVRFEIAGEPGQELLGEITLFNEEDEARIFYSSSENFEARGEGGTPHFLPGIEGLAAWITAPSQVVLEPGERKTIPFSIKIPQTLSQADILPLFFGALLRLSPQRVAK